MWAKLGKLLAKAAVWCVKHPDEIITVVKGVKAAKEQKDE